MWAKIGEEFKMSAGPRSETADIDMVLCACTDYASHPFSSVSKAKNQQHYKP